MGIFFERAEPSTDAIAEAIHSARQDTPLADDASAQRESAATAGDLRAKAQGKRLQESRLGLALGFFGLILLAGIACDAFDLDTSAKAMYRFAATILTATLALLAGEGAAS